MPAGKRPRRGSLQYSPRKRAKSENTRVRKWSSGDGLQGFVGYKVGMLSVVVQTNSAESPLANKDITKAATLVEVPPMVLKSIRYYKKTPYGDRVAGETKDTDFDADYARLIFETQPAKAGFPGKKPQEVEMAYGENLSSLKEFASKHMDKEVKFSEFFEPNEFVDAIAVTKGRGFQGPVKRFGVKLQQSKTEKSVRKVGSLGPWIPKRTPWQAAMAGQTGYHTRTQLNNQIVYVGEPVNPKGGWHKYGETRSECVVIIGSIQGPAKRQVKLRKAIRPPKTEARLLVQDLILGNEVKAV